MLLEGRRHREIAAALRVSAPTLRPPRARAPLPREAPRRPRAERCAGRARTPRGSRGAPGRAAPPQ